VVLPPLPFVCACVCRAGNKLYPLIHARNPDLAPKFTGMMLQLPVADIVSLVDNPTLLTAKLQEAAQVLERERWTLEGSR
jgi:hypothetical protein